MGGTYINPFTDFGFKKLFGEEADKANVNRDDQRAYQDSLKYYRDMKNSWMRCTKKGSKKADNS